MLDEYPRQDMVAFHSMVQKELTRRAERAEKQARATGQDRAHREASAQTIAPIRPAAFQAAAACHLHHMPSETGTIAALRNFLVDELF